MPFIFSSFVHVDLVLICTSHFGNKNANAPWAINRASQPQAQAELHGDLKRKLEFFCSCSNPRIRRACIDGHYHTMERGTTNSAAATATAPAPTAAAAAAAAAAPAPAPAPAATTATTAPELGEMYKDHEIVRDVREPSLSSELARNFLTKTGVKNLNVCKGN
ncbi:hypothetical protein OIU84_001871 [Salix udensis]|uniref:Uncharacterized protein n=1 Tax=Salix udensis TaxID=889485 RepID=A0AAD6K872_9ROSI|nr:hypothetical protein OIU84_001871 [Salix udensis]